MKRVIIAVAGTDGKREYKDVQLLPETKSRDVLAKLNLNGFQLSRPEGGAFGFNDDLAGETLTWHSSADGLATFAGLREALEKRPDQFPNQRSLLQDLSAVEEALQMAANSQIGFCLLLRVGASTSAQEWELRQGTCF